jgi:hypothetical protein
LARKAGRVHRSSLDRDSPKFFSGGNGTGAGIGSWNQLGTALYSQPYSLVEWFGSAEGGGHHGITNRHPLTEYKIRGLIRWSRRL